MAITVPGIVLSPAVEDQQQNLYNQEVVTTFAPNLNNVVSYKPNGEIITGNTILSYRYRYIDVCYADNGSGAGFSFNPANKTFYGVRNTDSQVLSQNPADYVYYETSGFGVNNYLFYKTIGGRQIQWFVGAAAPDNSWAVVPVAAIDLDLISSAVTSLSYQTVITARTTMTTTTDPETWDYSPTGITFRSTGDITPKFLVATLYIGANMQPWSAHQLYTYSWNRNGQSFTPSIPQPTTNRWLEVSINDVNFGSPQFICTITTND